MVINVYNNIHTNKIIMPFFNSTPSLSVPFQFTQVRVLTVYIKITFNASSLISYATINTGTMPRIRQHMAREIMDKKLFALT